MSAQYQREIAPAFSPIQEQVITCLASGLSFTAAAEAAGVHRNTIANWRRETPSFAAAFEHAAREQARAFREEALDAVPLATQAVLAILNDPGAPPALRLRAAGMIYKMADVKSAAEERPALAALQLSGQPWHPSPTLHISAQSHSAPPSRPSEGAAANHETLHNSAQPAVPTYRREAPKVGRNEPCPCGSARKFKVCCLNKNV